MTFVSVKYNISSYPPLIIKQIFREKKMDYKPQKITHLSLLPIDDSGYSPAQQQHQQQTHATGQQMNEQSGLKVPRGPVGVDTTYKPIDQFPNPYGVGPKTEVDFSQPLLQPLSHDIPTSPLPHQIDETLQPNYIPKPKITHDYIREYEQQIEPHTQRTAKEYLEKKKYNSKWEQLQDSMQFPILIALLYYVFHMPIFQSFLYQKIGFLPVTNEDGNMNIYGMTVTAILFGLCVYGIKGFVEYMQIVD